MDKIKGYKTVAFNLIMPALMLLAVLSPGADLPDTNAIQALLDGTELFLTSLWTAGNLIIRAVTDSPIFKKAPPAT